MIDWGSLQLPKKNLAILLDQQKNIDDLDTEWIEYKLYKADS